MQTMARFFLCTLFVCLPAYAQKWIPSDPATACVDAQDKALCAELLAMRDADQLARHAVLARGENPDENVPEIERVDAENIVKLDAIIAKHGWPGKTLAGSKARGAAWTIVQHAEAESRRKYIDIMTKAADAGELDWNLLALTIDRVLRDEGKPQIYGTQFHDVNGVMVPQPIEDEANVDARRKKVGLPPLAEYAALMNQVYKQKKPAVQ